MTVRMREGVYDAETENGIALLDGASGEYYDLNETGALVLRALLAGESAEQIAHALAERYDVTLADAEQDTAELVNGLRSAGLILVDDHEGGTGR